MAGGDSEVAIELNSIGMEDESLQATVGLSNNSKHNSARMGDKTYLGTSNREYMTFTPGIS